MFLRRVLGLRSVGGRWVEDEKRGGLRRGEGDDLKCEGP